MRFCWHARRYLLETVERPAPPVGLNEDPNIYSCRWVGSRKGRGVKDLYSDLINWRFGEDINCSSARRHEGGDRRSHFHLFCAIFSNAVSISRCWVACSMTTDQPFKR